MAIKGLILFHGAGGDREHPLFLALEERLDISVDRVNFRIARKDQVDDRPIGCPN